MSLVPIVDALKAKGWVEEECISTMSLTKPTTPPSHHPLATVWYDEDVEKWKGRGDDDALNEARTIILGTAKA